MKMKIRDLCYGESLTESINHALKYSGKNGLLGVVLTLGGIVGTWLLCEAIESKGYAYGIKDGIGPHEKLLAKFIQAGKITEDEIIHYSKEISKEAGLPVEVETAQRDEKITVTKF